MAAGLLPPVQYHIDTDAELEAKLAGKGLKVVEIFSDWCGPCKSVLPTFRRIRLDRDDENALLFLTVCAEKCNFLEAAKEHRGRSEPLFLLYRNGQLKARIEGANTPALNQQVLALTPANADVDDLEENPIYLAKMERERIARGETVSSSKGGKKGKNELEPQTAARRRLQPLRHEAYMPKLECSPNLPT